MSEITSRLSWRSADIEPEKGGAYLCTIEETLPSGRKKRYVQQLYFWKMRHYYGWRWHRKSCVITHWSEMPKPAPKNRQKTQVSAQRRAGDY